MTREKYNATNGRLVDGLGYTPVCFECGEISYKPCRRHPKRRYSILSFLWDAFLAVAFVGGLAFLATR